MDFTLFPEFIRTLVSGPNLRIYPKAALLLFTVILSLCIVYLLGNSGKIIDVVHSSGIVYPCYLCYIFFIVL